MAGIRLCYDVITELKRQQAQLFVDLSQTCFLVRRQVSTVLRKGFVGLREESHLLGSEVERFTLLIHGLDTLEERIIEDDVTLQIGEHRTHFLRNLIHLVITVCFEHIEEDTLDTIEHQTGAIQRLDGVGKGGFFGVIHDSLYFRFLSCDRFLESR